MPYFFHRRTTFAVCGLHSYLYPQPSSIVEVELYLHLLIVVYLIDNDQDVSVSSFLCPLTQLLRRRPLSGPLPLADIPSPSPSRDSTCTPQAVECAENMIKRCVETKQRTSDLVRALRLRLRLRLR